MKFGGIRCWREKVLGCLTALALHGPIKDPAGRTASWPSARTGQSQSRKRLFVAALLLIYPVGRLSGQSVASRTPARQLERSPASLIGGGNFTNGETDTRVQAQYLLLRQLGATQCRMNLYPGFFLKGNDWSKPNPTALDAAMKLAHDNGITPMILFEYYVEYPQKAGLPFGTHDQWAGVGHAFAERFRPNGVWGKENGIKDWGVTVYTAFNEPDGGDFRKGGKVGPEPYVTGMRGLADGVHGVDPALKVLPGGFLAANAFADWTLRGLGPALASLWNDGTLDGIDLHTYYDVQYAPMEGTYQRSAQANFDSVKKASGITRDIHFYTTEFNYKLRKVTEEQAARGFLTGLWDNLGVVQNDGHTSAVGFAFPWNLFNDAGKDTNYGMRKAGDPSQPDLRGKVLQTVLDLTRGLTFQSLDPHTHGMYVLYNIRTGTKLWVWQDRTAWTDTPGHTFTLTDIPMGTRRIAVYGWNGLRKTLPVAGRTLIITDLPGDETYMFLATPIPTR